jgi:hypothetical protein
MLSALTQKSLQNKFLCRRIYSSSAQEGEDGRFIFMLLLSVSVSIAGKYIADTGS